MLTGDGTKQRLPCSLGIFPQGFVAVTVAAQVASISARLSTPVLFFLPVATSHSPQAWKSYLHSPGKHGETSLLACVWRRSCRGAAEEVLRRCGCCSSNQTDNLQKSHNAASAFVLTKQPTVIRNTPHQHPLQPPPSPINLNPGTG